jgi:hypothetical protein
MGLPEASSAAGRPVCGCQVGPDPGGCGANLLPSLRLIVGVAAAPAAVREPGDPMARSPSRPVLGCLRHPVCLTVHVVIQPGEHAGRVGVRGRRGVVVRVRGSPSRWALDLTSQSRTRAQAQHNGNHRDRNPQTCHESTGHPKTSSGRGRSRHWHPARAGDRDRDAVPGGTPLELHAPPPSAREPTRRGVDQPRESSRSWCTLSPGAFSRSTTLPPRMRTWGGPASPGESNPASTAVWVAKICDI